MKRYWLLAIVAFFVLAFAAVWMGALNQDEGWYLYAANLVAAGKVPYVEFDFTQGPVMPYFYSVFAFVWRNGGILGARIFTLTLGFVGIVFAALFARRLADEEHREKAFFLVFVLLALNLYHIYYLAIPKAYALSAIFVLIGFYVLSFARYYWLVGIALALATGTRLSFGILLPIVGAYLLWRRNLKATIAFVVGALAALALIFLPFAVIDFGAIKSCLIDYHLSREGMGLFGKVGSLSRLVRWYLPIFILLGLGDFKRNRLLLVSFIAVFAVQFLSPCPYDDYQAPIMALLAVFAVLNVKSQRVELLTLGLAFACAFGSPLLEKWTTDGLDRFWTMGKDRTELAGLRAAARVIEKADPSGKTLLTQDLYLAIETGRAVPKGLEMGPFATLTDAEWRKLLSETAPDECAVAALSGYTFAVNPPKCDERPLEKQMEYWELLKERYRLVERMENFGQNSTTLLILKRK